MVPDHGPCATLNPPITVQGSGFPPGMAVAVTDRRASAPPNQPRGTVGHATVGADGTFTVSGMLSSCAPPLSDGTQIVIEAVDPPPPPGGGYLTILASTTFTKEAAATTIPGLPNTGGGTTARGRVVFDRTVLGGLLGLFCTLLIGSFRWRRSRR